MDLAIASLVSISSSAGICYLASQFLKNNKQYKEIQQAKSYSPSSLLSEFSKSQSTTGSGFKKRQSDPNEYSTNAFVEGYVHCREPLRSIVNKNTNLVYSLIYKQEIREKNPLLEAFHINIKNQVETQVNAPLYFTLHDSRSPKSYCLVHRNLDVDAQFGIQKIGEIEDIKPFKVLENIVHHVGKLFGSSTASNPSLWSLRGISLGVSETEFGIKVGSALTIYGEVIYNLREKSLRIDSPLYFLKDRAMLVNSLKEKIGKMEVGLILLVGVFVASTVYLVRKGRRYMQEKKEKELYKYNRRKGSREMLNEDYKCIVCFERPRQVILKPCMHFTLCSNCCESLEQKICPICKEPIKDIMRIYVP